MCVCVHTRVGSGGWEGLNTIVLKRKLTKVQQQWSDHFRGSSFAELFMSKITAFHIWDVVKVGRYGSYLNLDHINYML